MQTVLELKERLKVAFADKQASVLAEAIFTSYNELVKVSDFDELKNIVKELAEAQKETRAELKELAEAQKRTEYEILTLTKELKTTRGDLGGLSKTMGYTFENEAFRTIPKVLKEKYGITMEDKLIRAEVGDREINIYGKGKIDGKDVLIVGEAKLRLDDKRQKRAERGVFEELEEKVMAAKEESGEIDIVRLLITHFATRRFLKEANERGIIVIQSFEW